MRLGQRRQQPEEAQVDLTSMLDIVFIMLIFFIVTSVFVNESGVDVERPQAHHATSQADANVFVAITANNEIYIDNRLVDIERVTANLVALVNDVSEVSLVIQADAFAFNGTVVKVMDAAKGAGIQNIALATQPSNE